MEDYEIMKTNDLSYITIGCPVRDREQYLPYYLDCIKKQDYPLNKITLLFVENDSQDSTFSILNKFKSENSSLFHRINIYKYDLNVPQDSRYKSHRRQVLYHSLAKLRNYWLSHVRTDYAISCDSDIMMPPHIVSTLVSHRLDYVAGLVCNGYLSDSKQPTRITNIFKKGVFGGIQITDYPENSLIKVDYSGAIMCLSKKACKLGKFAYFPQGEDGAFCDSLRNQGIKLYCDTSCKCTHVMSLELLEKFKKEGFFF